jgi:alpha-L-arabinofuranosidase
VHGGVGRLPDITHVPYLDAVAVRDADGNISLFCVNRDASKDLNAEISMDGFNAKPEAEAQAISAPNITARNDEVTPDAVKPVKSTVQLNGNSLRFTFRHASVTRIDFPVK